MEWVMPVSAHQLVSSANVHVRFASPQTLTFFWLHKCDMDEQNAPVGCLDATLFRFGPELESTVLAQNVVHWLFAMYCCVMSGTMMHRSLPFSKTVNRSWAVAVVLAMALQTAFSGVYIFAYGRGRLMSLTTLPIAVYVVAFVWPFVLMATNSKVRRHFAAKDAREQRWIKLRFSTKLGMHSPK
eukprot:m.1242156 g.1242156  ORF g.1242156 m.1242156 type:complete len:184 (-) comp24682_c0_seq2:57-608(-)